MREVIDAVRTLVEKIRAGNVTLADYLHAVSILIAAYLELAPQPIGAPTAAAEADDLHDAVDALSAALDGTDAVVPAEGPLATALIIAAIRAILKQI